MQEYVKTFSYLMLNIKNMSEEDKLFNSISGLQPWAQLELKRQFMCDLHVALSTVDALVDYKYTKSNANNEKQSRGTQAKTSKRKMARRIRISKRKIVITRARGRVLPLNKAKKSLN